MDRLLHDLRSAIRQLRKHVSSTTLAVGTLALGIGSTAAVVSVVDTLILRELPYPDADRIVTIWQNNTRDGVPREEVAPANYLDWKDRNQSFEVMGAAEPYSVDLTGDGSRPEVLFALQVTDGFFETLRVQPLHGRLLRPEDFQLGSSPVVILSYGVWQRRFGGAASLIGRSLTLDATPTEVVGILPPNFELGLLRASEDRDAWLPRQFQGWEQQSRGSAWWNVIGRIADGTSLDQARADMDRVAATLESEHPTTNRGSGITLVPLHEHLVGSAGSALLVLLGAALLVLLIGCANVANLLLARGADREAEFAVRTAMGAQPRRIMRQLLTEALGLALVAGSLGIVLAFWGVDVIKALSPADIPRMDQVVVDLRVLGFAVGITLFTAIAFGFAPAFHFSRVNLSDALRDSKGSAGRARQRLRRGLIVTETALALSLLVGAGLLVRSFVTLLNVDPGFTQENVAAFQVFAYQDGETTQERVQFFEESLERIRNLPGVTSAGAVEAAPFLAADMAIRVNFTIDGEPAPVGEEPQSYISAATADYFETLGVPLVAGRLLNTFDRADGEAVTVINQTMRERFWPGEDPIGKYIHVVGRETPIAIVGVVGAVRHGSLENDPRPEFFVPHTQRPSGSMTYFVRSNVDAAAIMGSVQEEIWRVQPLLSFYHTGTVDALIDTTLRSRRFSMVLLMSFAIIALVMAAVGLYGVISYSVSQRTREVGIRMALGAAQTDVVSLVVRDGVAAIGIGIVIGVIGSVAAARVIANQLFGITPHDTITYGGAALVLLLVGLVASYLPARRAAKVDPARTLREA